MNHNNWGETYMKEAELLKERIFLLRKQLKTCKKEELSTIRRRITLLSEMYFDCVYTGTYLKLRREACLRK